MLARESRLRESCNGWKTWDVRHSIRDLRSYDLTAFHTLSLWLEIQQSKSFFPCPRQPADVMAVWVARTCQILHMEHRFFGAREQLEVTGHRYIYVYIKPIQPANCSSPLKTSRKSPSTRTSTGCTVSMGTALRRQAQSPAFAMSDLIFRLGGKCKLVSWWRSGLGSSYGLAYGLHCRCWMLVSSGK